MIDQETIFVGHSHRTNSTVADQLKHLLSQFKIIPLPFEKKYLHLDCVFNIVSSDLALIYPKAFAKKEIDELASCYEFIEVSEEEQFQMGTNVLSIGDKRIISLPVNKKVNEELRKRGFQVIEVDISEIIKSGGSFRCCTLPVLRDM